MEQEHNMDDKEKRNLVLRHAQLVAAHAAGQRDVLEELREIESKLGLNAEQIAQLAIDQYLRDY